MYIIRETEKIRGGVADREPDSRFNKNQLKEGMKVEAEHTNDKSIQKEIAKDHIKENGTIGSDGVITSDYYSKLSKVEGTNNGSREKLTQEEVRRQNNLARSKFHSERKAKKYERV